MSYATEAALAERYGTDLLVQITDRATPPAGLVDAGVVARALADTDATIDAALGVRYLLPLRDVPAVVVDLALAIAIYKLHRFVPDQKIRDDYDQALRDLRAIAKGELKLDVAGVEPAGNGSGGVRVTDRDRPLTADTLTGFI
jgi:phage gp36-like protein